MKHILSLIISGALVVSGFGQTRNVLVGTNNAVVQPTNFWSVDAANARTGLGLGTAATNPASAFQPSSTVLSNLASSNAVNLTNLRATNIVGTIPAANIGSLTLTNISGILAISNGGSGATTAGQARTNLELGATNIVSFSIVTANSNIDTPKIFIQDTTNDIIVFEDPTNAVRLRSNIGLGKTNLVEFGTIKFGDQQYQDYGLMLDGAGLYIYGGVVSGGTNFIFDVYSTANFLLHRPISFNNTTNSAFSRTNLGLGLPALTNTNNANFLAAFFGANTNPVLVNTGGVVVSPTNFWQAAPINTALQNLTNVVATSTNAATNARMLFLYSLAPTVTNVTSTITLPTNGNTFGGDVATITHLGPTSSVTAIRALGAGTNIITLNQPEESVRLIYRNSGWTLMDNISYIEPIYFSGTNAAQHAAESRTNLGLGTTNSVQFAYVEAPYFFVGDGTNGIVFETLDVAAITRTNLGLGATNDVNFASVNFGGGSLINSTEIVWEGDQRIDFETRIFYGGGWTFDSGPIGVTGASNQATTRTNLGLGFPALTNTTVTNFQKAIFYTNTAPSNIGGNLGTIAAWIEIVASNGVTYKIPAYTNVP